MAHYTKGDSVEVRGQFDNGDPVSPAPVDPLTVKFVLTDPDKVKTEFLYGVDPEIVRENVGLYMFYVLLSTDGYWRVRFAGEGPRASAEETSITVHPSIV